MEARQAYASWRGPERDILTVLIGPTPRPYGADPADDDRVVFYRILDDHEEATGDIVGVEIDAFLDFDHWDAIPTLSEHWQLRDIGPAPLPELLQSLQATLRAQTRTPAHV